MANISKIKVASLNTKVYSILLGQDFNGCMSNMLINNFPPLKSHSNTFTGKCLTSKLPRDVLSEQYSTTDLITAITDDYVITTEYEITTENYEDTTINYENDSELEQSEEEDNFTVVKIVIFLVLVTILTIAYFVQKYIKRHTGVYLTREDAGEAEALDADTAVLHSKTLFEVF